LTPSYPIGSATADLDGDGRADLVMAEAIPNPAQIQAMLATATRGTFSAQTYASGVAAGAVKLGDLDRDGHVDIVNDLRTGTLAILRGSGGNVFTLPYMVNVFTSPPGQIALADMNGDGILDIVVAGEVDQVVAVLYGHGDATFAAPVTYPAPHASGLVVRDFDRDGHLDVVAIDPVGGNVNVLLAKCGP
jgi:hypothetical protein